MATNIQVRRGTAAEWTSANPTLMAGELGFETDTTYYKIGNGATAWNSLGYGAYNGAIGSGTITSAMILDGTIVNADINASAGIDKTKISGTAITAADTGTVTSTMISDGTIVNADINASAAIAYSKLNLSNSIVDGDITAGAVTATKLANTAVTAGTYSTASITVDAQGRITSASAGTAFAGDDDQSILGNQVFG